MGRRGPLPDPKSERSATGRNTLAARARTSAVEKVSPPKHVAARAAAAAFWKTHAGTLSEEGRLRQVHAELFAQLCHLHADVLELQERIAVEGWVIATDKGQAISPIARLLRDSRRDLVTLAGRFGLTAADEARLPGDEESHGKEDDEEAALRSFTG